MNHIIGDKINNFEFLGISPDRKHIGVFRCTCGETFECSIYFIDKRKNGCGCKEASYKKDKYNAGDKIGVYTYIEDIYEFKTRYCKVKCDCGKESVLSLCNIKRAKSCGCKPKNYKHGLTNTPEYSVLTGMKSRCFNTKEWAYQYYGGRGITVCDRWLEPKGQGFLNFVEDMGERPSPEYSIDRIDVNGNYEPSNCRWATDIEQANNTRSNNIIHFDGKSMSISQWERELSLTKGSIDKRLRRGWTIERILTTPIDKRFAHYKNK